eukprot:UN18529
MCLLNNVLFYRRLQYYSKKKIKLVSPAQFYSNALHAPEKYLCDLFKGFHDYNCEIYLTKQS